MIRNLIFLLASLIFFTHCDQEKSKNTESTSKSELQSENDPKQNLKVKTGLKIENGINQGIRANTKLGIKNPVIYTTSIITNDGSIPIRLQMALSEEYEFPALCGDSSTYKVFLFPKELTPDTATLTNTIVSGENDFLKSPLDKPYAFNKILKPNEYCVITMGTLYSGSSNCEVIPRAVFSPSDRELYGACDTQINRSISVDPQLEIRIKLEFYNQRKFIAPEDHCTIIPCGQVALILN